MDEFKNKGWKNPGYHYVILKDGRVLQLLDTEKVSNGVKGYNETAINLAWVGGITQKDGKTRPIDNRTEEQKQSLVNLLKALRILYPEAKIMGHRSIWGENHPEKWEKVCPCFDAIKEYRNI